MISCYFGAPGSGKSSVLTLIAQKELSRISKGKSRYNRVYTNFPCSGCYKINFSDLGFYYFHDALILLDELTLSADNRDWKNFSEQTKKFITLHRHFNIDIIYTVQDWSRAEKTIRNNTVNLYYVTNFLYWSRVRPIFRTININEYVSELIMGYRFPDFWEALQQGHIYYIKKAWKFYNSFDKYGFDKLDDPVYKFKDVWG